MTTRPIRSSAVKAKNNIYALENALKRFDQSMLVSDDDESDEQSARAVKRVKSARSDSKAEVKDTDDTKAQPDTLEENSTLGVMAESDSDEEGANENEEEEEEEEEESESSDGEQSSKDDDDFILDPSDSPSEIDDDDDDDEDGFDYDLFDAEVERLEFNVSSVLYSEFGIENSTYKCFLRGAMLVHNITSSMIMVDSVDDVDNIRPFLSMLKLPFAKEVSSESLKTAVASIQQINWSKRDDILKSIVELIPNGGIAFKTFHFIRPIMCYLAAAHALSHAVLDTSPHQEEEDILDVVFGDLSPEEIERKQSVRTVDGAVAQSNGAVEKWVNGLNGLEDDHEFIRRIVGSISTLNAPAHVRTKARGNRMTQPIYYGLCDTKIVNHESRRVNKSNKMLLRVMLVCATDNSDNVKHTLELLGKRLRVRGAGGFHGKTPSEHQIRTDPNPSITQYYHGCVASMNSIEIDMDNIKKGKETPDVEVNPVLVDAFEKLISPSKTFGKTLKAIGAQNWIDDDSYSTNLPPLDIKPVESDGKVFKWDACLKLPAKPTYTYRTFTIHEALVEILNHRSMDSSGVKTIVFVNSLLHN